MVIPDFTLPKARVAPSRRRRHLLVTGVAAAVWTARSRATPATVCPAWLDLRVPRLQDEQPVALCDFAGQVLLIVNTASRCGYTPQYQGLQALHRRYQAQGLAVLGFPSNDFGQQEPGSREEIATFCHNQFDVAFPMFVRLPVRGPGAHPLFAALAARTGQPPAWNFHKYLVGRDGQTVRAYPSAVAPEDPRLIRDIERLLSR